MKLLLAFLFFALPAVAQSMVMQTIIYPSIGSSEVRLYFDVINFTPVPEPRSTNGWGYRFNGRKAIFTDGEGYLLMPPLDYYKWPGQEENFGEGGFGFTLAITPVYL